ncbi:hypothetical protein FRB95_004887 [Tulasnella sp. JGI-2019a]|nr:hypothetical protein FRB95_004887 [Tulasnella sp. JGI-2019a]
MSYSYIHDLDKGLNSAGMRELVLTNPPPSRHTHHYPYHKGSRSLVVFGLVLALITGSAFIFIGIVIYHRSPSGEKYIRVDLSRWADVALGLSFNALVTVCTDATGYVHGTTLKWGLASEGRLEFNTNMRLFRTTKGALSVNGPVVNTIYIISIIFSYAASSTVFLHSSIFPKFLSKLMGSQPPAQSYSIVSFLPPIILGLSLAIQAILGLIAFFKTEVPTWSSSPLDVASALVYHQYVRHRPQRCMRPVTKIQNSLIKPVPPLSVQPSALSSHRTVYRSLWFVWIALAVWAGWMGIWGFYGVPDRLQFNGSVAPLRALGLGVLYLAAVQSVVTIDLHCCEMVTTLARDELVWRAASTPAGAQPAGNPLIVVLGSWQSVGLLLTKPATHWFFGITLSIVAGEGLYGTSLILCFPLVLLAVALFTTIVVTRQPLGPQPATYGHVQTLADLVDRWSMVMYWGDKEKLGWPVGHAGTSDVPLPPVKMGELYA